MYEGGILTAAINGSAADAADVHVIMSDRSVLTYSPDVRSERRRKDYSGTDNESMTEAISWR